MTDPLVTIVVTPRERYGKSADSLESIYKHTTIPFQLVYVSAGSPPDLTAYLEAQSEKRGFKLIKSESYLPPNRARNLGLREVRTRYVAFADNDLLVTPKWLDALVSCAERTGAWVVGPLYFEGNPDDQVIHMAGGFNRLVKRGDREVLRIIHRHYETPLASVTEPLACEPCTDVEFHLMLVRMEAFDRIGPLDENLLAMHEHLDLCYMVQAAGGAVYFEPASRVTHTRPPPWEPGDLPFFLRRWSDQWNLASVRHFDAKWGISSEHVVQPWVEQHRFRYLDGTHMPGNLARTDDPVLEAAVTIAAFQTAGCQYYDVLLLDSDGREMRRIEAVEGADVIERLPGLWADAAGAGQTVAVRPRTDVACYTTISPTPSSESPALRAERLGRLRQFVPVITDEASAKHRGMSFHHSRPALIRITDLDAAAKEQFQEMAFVTLETAPARFECWIAVEGSDADSAAAGIGELLAGTSGRIAPEPIAIVPGATLASNGGRHRVHLVEAVAGRMVGTEVDDEASGESAGIA